MRVFDNTVRGFFNFAGFTKGVQSRSRAVLAYAQGNHAPCPDKLWESRPCKATTCQSFIWRTSRWTSSKGRRVWCEKSDGLLVTGKLAKHLSSYMYVFGCWVILHAFLSSVVVPV